MFTNNNSQKIVFSDGTEIVTGLDHEWFTSDKKERERNRNHIKSPPKSKTAIKIYESVKTTEEIKRTLKYGKENNHSVAVCEPIKGAYKDLPVDPYLLGYWLGNGSKSSSRITVNNEDLKEICKILSDKGVKYSVKDYGKIGASYLNILEIYPLLRELKVLDNKHIPEIYLTASLNQRLELLQGLLDSDGTIDDRGRCSITSGVKSLWQGIEFLISSFGLKL